MADVEYELKELLSEHRLELKKKELDEKYPARKKLADAGYELTGFATDENGQNTISSTWTVSYTHLDVYKRQIFIHNNIPSFIYFHSF